MSADENGFRETVAAEFTHVPGYLDTASVGLPPRVSVEELRSRLDDWVSGRCDPHSFDPEVARARDAYSRIVEANASTVAIMSQVSVATGLVASSMPDGATVMCAAEDFTSVLFPFLASDRLGVVTVSRADLLDSIDSSVDLVAVSAVQSSSGAVTDLDRLADLANKWGFRTFVDVTQAAGWLPIGADRFDVTACHAYKWLCSPRGAGFLTVSERAMEWVRPTYPGWYSGDEPWSSIYGPPLRLARDARRFDASPAWFSYTAAASALELIAELGVHRIGSHSIALANDFRHAIGLAASNSPIVSLSTSRGEELAEAGIVVSGRAGRARFSFYMYNDDNDVEAAARIVGSAAE